MHAAKAWPVRHLSIKGPGQLIEQQLVGAEEGTEQTRAVALACAGHAGPFRNPGRVLCLFHLCPTLWPCGTSASAGRDSSSNSDSPAPGSPPCASSVSAATMQRMVSRRPRRYACQPSRALSAALRPGQSWLAFLQPRKQRAARRSREQLAASSLAAAKAILVRTVCCQPRAQHQGEGALKKAY